MKRLRRMINRFRFAFFGQRRDFDLADELKAHIQMQIEDNLAAGMPPEIARRAAALKFGNVECIKESYRDQRSLPLLEILFSDLRFGLRMLGKNTGFTVIAVSTLALGIGANTAMFSVVNAVLLEPLPYKDAGRLMVINERDEKHNQVEPYSLSYLNFQDWSRTQNSFSELALVGRSVLYKLNGRARNLIAARMVSGNFLSMLGISPIVGRGFTSDDDRQGAMPTIILSYSGWQKFFGPLKGAFAVGYATNLFDEKLQFNGSTYTVIGVMPPEFKFFTFDSNQNADGYIPIGLAPEPWMTNRARRGGISALGRLRPGITHRAALTELEEISHRLAVSYPVENENRGASITPLFDSVVSDDLRRTLHLLTGALGIVLLIACANVANLLLARGTTRQKELAIRHALGGGGRRVAAQLIFESVVVAVAGGATGLLVAIAGTDLLVLRAPVQLTRIDTIGIDWRVLLFAGGISILSGIAFGIAPAVQALRANIQDELKEGGRTSSAATRFVPQKALIVGEVALALILLLAAGLVLRSTEKALSVDPGFDPEHVWFFSVITSPAEFPTAAETQSFFRRLETRLVAMPEVQGVTVALGGLPKPVAVDPDYLRVMGIRLLKGRFFDEHDTQTAPAVIVLDEAAARARFREKDPISQSFVIDMPGGQTMGLERPRQIIGVVNHIQIPGIETNGQLAQLQAQIGFYLPSEQLPDAFAAPLSGMLIKTSWSGEKIRNELETTVHAINRNAEVTGLIKMHDAIAFALVPRRFVTKLLAVLAFIAFVLAAMGIFGLMTYSVSQRTQEIGLRMALGAEPRHVVRMVAKQAGGLAAAGIVLGLLCSVAVTRFIGYLLFNISSVDPTTYATAVTLLFCVALAAAYIPAWRATQLEPVTALKGIINFPLHLGAVPSEARHGSSNAETFPAKTTSAPLAVEVQHLQKTYITGRGRTVAALSGVSFSVHPGTIFGLIGQNGAGKTTLVKILLGLAKPTSGSARLLGCSPGDPIANRQIGYLPEQMRIPSHFVAEKFLRYMGRLNSVDSTTLNVRIPELLETVGLGGVHKAVKTYSKGMQQRLGLAQALVNDPEILFLDEPTDGLDPMGRILVRDLLLQLRAAGKTIFLNSHLLSEVELVCDRIVILNKGVVACTTTPQEFARGTGEYIMRFGTPDAMALEAVQRIVDSIIGSAVWQNTVLRFAPRDAAQLNELLDAVRAIRVPIISIEPVRLSLEQFFIQVITEKES